MTSVFRHCRDSFSFWIVQFNLEVFVNLGVGPADMADNSVDLWQQGLNIFSSPKITGIPSPDTVQNTLENLTAGTESRVPVSPPDEESRVSVSLPYEEMLSVFTTQPLNLDLGGGPYSLFQPQPHRIAVATIFIELPQAEPQGPPNRGINPSVS